MILLEGKSAAESPGEVIVDEQSRVVELDGEQVNALAFCSNGIVHLAIEQITENGEQNKYIGTFSVEDSGSILTGTAETLEDGEKTNVRQKLIRAKRYR